MCGIAGYHSSTSVPGGVLRAMTDALAHRGPDASGYYESGPVHLGHRRLSVIDIAGSPQPMSSADGALTIIYNGEIYNFRALRDELAGHGWTFRTDGDTEVLLAAWHVWGEAMVQHLRGMFAFALWDARDESLFIARDHLGVKPLHYAWDGTTLVFGSELKAVLAHPSVASIVDPAALRLFLECQFIPAPHTILQSVHKLLPAHSLLLRGGQLREETYWRVDHVPKLRLSDDEAIERLDAALREAVTGMLVSDVPLGAFVSGGLDSALIAALMTDISGGPVMTFNIGFHGKGVDSEHLEAAAVAEHLGSDHHALMLGPHDVLGAFDEWMHVFDEPFADQAALPTLLLSREARRHVTVVLTGEGADEVFAGYSNYGKRLREERLTRWLGHRASPVRALVRALPSAARKDRLLRAIAEPLARRYRTVPNLFDVTQHRDVLSPAMLAATREAPDIGQLAAEAFEQCDSPEYLDRLLYVDTKLWLPDDLLAKVDRATMAHSLEARVPYLDHRFYEFAARLEPSQKLRGTSHKDILKRLARRYLPSAIVDREKHGFVMPLGEWLAGPLAGELSDHLASLATRGIFRIGLLAKLLAAYRGGRRSDAGRLWALLILERWFRRHAPDWRLAG
ncbi:MAG: asparagine synthase (glutamine-hydrolyzing) [Pseudomonadota bacterium]|nr:asparagine synthase (glutamine-hydrolyzing) [Pseudomonadota bacterium]